MEHPAPRHSNPASMKVWSSPSRSAAKRTLFEPGTTSAFTEPETLWPCTTLAASLRSDNLEFVHEPIKATSIGVPLIKEPALNPINSIASATESRSVSTTSAGFGIRPPMPTD